MSTRWLDRLLMLLFALTSFVALFYAPSFYLGCGWDGLGQGLAGPCGQDWIGRAWLGYLELEPIYADAPLWLRMMNELDSWLFGWFYLLSLILFATGRQDRAWYRALATFMAGMMTYAMTLYIGWQIASYPHSGAALGSVIALNGIWLLVFGLLMLRLHVLRPRTS